MGTSGHLLKPETPEHGTPEHRKTTYRNTEYRNTAISEYRNTGQPGTPEHDKKN